MKSIYSCKNKCANTKNKDNKKNKIISYICINMYQYFQYNCKIITKNKFNKNKKDKMSNIINKDIERKEL